MLPWIRVHSHLKKQLRFISQLTGETNMAFKEGDVYQCPDQKCGCEITVTKGCEAGQGGNLAPRCCCGKEMKKIK
jgi:hypothetical protein